jgi:hypothetical protein
MEILRVRFSRFLLLMPVLITTMWAADPTIGTWTLNVQRSKFVPGPGFRSETRTYEEQKDGVKVTIRTVDGKGRKVTTVYLATPDGQQHAVNGVGGPADSVGLKQIDALTAESTLMHAGKEIAKTTRVVSRDRQTMTITYKGLDPDGNPVDYMMFFAKGK